MSRAEIRAERLKQALRSLPMFRGLKAPELERLEAIAAIREFDRGAALWQAGDTADHLTLIVRGRAKIVRHGPVGDVILEIFGVGEPVGAMAVFEGMPYPATAIALEPLSLVCIPRREFFGLLEMRPEFARAIVRELTKLTVSLMRKLEEMRGQRVESRIARLFLTLAERMGKPTPEGVEVPLALTRLEIAEMVGTTVESSIRVLSRWGREGVLITGEDRFVIPSIERLQLAAEAIETTGKPACEP